MYCQHAFNRYNESYLYIERSIAAARAKVLANTYSDFRRQNDFFCPSTHVTYTNDGACGLDKRSCRRKRVSDYDRVIRKIPQPRHQRWMKGLNSKAGLSAQQMRWKWIVSNVQKQDIWAFGPRLQSWLAFMPVKSSRLFNSICCHRREVKGCHVCRYGL